MEPAQLIECYPKLYHMAMDGSWPSIRRHGLHSTTSLLDLFAVNRDRRKAIESARRPSSVTLQHPKYGRAVIRDNIPLREAALAKCLEDMSPRQWYEHLNKHVFFWPTEERLTKLLSARAYRESAHVVITVSTEALLARTDERVLLSPINSGSTIYNPPRRGRDTFLPLDSYPFEHWASLRGRRKAVAEVAILGQLRNIDELIVGVDRRKGDRILSRL